MCIIFTDFTFTISCFGSSSAIWIHDWKYVDAGALQKLEKLYTSLRIYGLENTV